MLLSLVENECLWRGDVCDSACSHSRNRDKYTVLKPSHEIFSQDVPVGSNIMAKEGRANVICHQRKE